MRTTVSLDDDVYEAARTLARTTNRSLGSVLSELARRGLERRAPRQVDEGLPVFDVSPDAKIIPGHRAAELLAEEGVD